MDNLTDIVRYDVSDMANRAVNNQISGITWHIANNNCQEIAEVVYASVFASIDMATQNKINKK
jgi:hypothetical protein